QEQGKHKTPSHHASPLAGTRKPEGTPFAPLLFPATKHLTARVGAPPSGPAAGQGPRPAPGCRPAGRGPSLEAGDHLAARAGRERPHRGVAGAVGHELYRAVAEEEVGPGGVEAPEVELVARVFEVTRPEHVGPDGAAVRLGPGGLAVDFVH